MFGTFAGFARSFNAEMAQNMKHRFQFNLAFPPWDTKNEVMEISNDESF